MSEEKLKKDLIDRSLLSSINRELFYQSLQDNALSFLYGCIGFGVMLILISVGFLFFRIGYSSSVDNSENTKQIVNSFITAFQDVVIKVQAEGSVNISNPVVYLDNASTVKFVPGTTVSLSPDSSVAVNAQIKVSQPKPSTQQLGLEQKLENGLSPSTEYVIFKEIPFRKGFVTTGTVFSMTNNVTPKYEYCFYRENIGTDKNIRVHLGKNGTMNDNLENSKLPFKKEDAYPLCQWSII